MKPKKHKRELNSEAVNLKVPPRMRALIDEGMELWNWSSADVVRECIDAFLPKALDDFKRQSKRRLSQ